jgi:diguanylate cyclase (GGDEF)-like protein
MVAALILWGSYLALSSILPDHHTPVHLDVTILVVLVSASLLGYVGSVGIVLMGWVGLHLVTMDRIDLTSLPSGLVTADNIVHLLTLLIVSVTVSSIGALRRRSALERRHFDGLTDVLTHSMFKSKFEEVLERGGGQTITAVLLIDVNRLKLVNDLHGHDVGNELLKDLAMRLRSSVRRDDLVARVGGDEFAVALFGLVQPYSAIQIAEKLAKLLNAPYGLKGKVVHISASIGVATLPEDGSTVDALVHQANEAMRLSKRASESSVNRVQRERLDAGDARTAIPAPHDPASTSDRHRE